MFFAIIKSVYNVVSINKETGFVFVVVLNNNYWILNCIITETDIVISKQELFQHREIKSLLKKKRKEKCCLLGESQYSNDS